MEKAFVEKWQTAAATKTGSALLPLLSDDFRLISPVAFKPYENKREIEAIFGAIMRVLPNLIYTKTATFAGGAMMTFEGDLAAGLRVEGIDVFTLNHDGRAQELKVFVRPLKAAAAFAEAMADALKGS